MRAYLLICVLLTSFCANAEDQLCASKSFLISYSENFLCKLPINSTRLDTIKLADRIKDIHINYPYDLVFIDFEDSASIVLDIQKKITAEAEVLWSASGELSIVKYAEEMDIIRTHKLFDFLQGKKDNCILQRIVAPELSNISVSTWYGDSTLLLQTYYSEQVSCSIYLIQKRKNLALGSYSLVTPKLGIKIWQSLLAKTTLTQIGEGRVENGIFTFYIGGYK